MIGACRLVGYNAIDVLRHCLSKVEVNIVQKFRIRLVNIWVIAMTEFEGHSSDEMGLLVRRQRIIEQLGLVKVLLELGPANALFDAFYLLFEPATNEQSSIRYIKNGSLCVTAFRGRNGVASVLPIRVIVEVVGINTMIHHSTTMVVENRADGSVDWELEWDKKKIIGHSAGKRLTCSQFMPSRVICVSK